MRGKKSGNEGVRLVKGWSGDAIIDPAFRHLMPKKKPSRDRGPFDTKPAWKKKRK